MLLAEALVAEESPLQAGAAHRVQALEFVVWTSGLRSARGKDAGFWVPAGSSCPSAEGTR